MNTGKLKRKICLYCKGIIYRRKLIRHKRRCLSALSPPNVLVVISTLGIGNAVEATPFVQAVRMLWPGSDITLFTLKGDIFKDWAIPDLIVDSIDKIKGQSYDHTFFTNWVLKDISKWSSQCELGVVHFPKVWIGKFLLKPEREYYLDMLKKFDFKGITPPLYVSVKRPDIELPEAELRIALVPGGKKENIWRHKRWPYYDRLCRSLLSEYPQAQICIIGTREDEFPGQLPQDTRVIDLRSKLSLAQTAWVLRNTDVAVGNDCGPMHIADAVRTKSIVIFGPTCELKNSYLNKVTPVSFDLKCRPCQYGSRIETCKEPLCMENIPENLIIQKIKELL